MMNMKMMNMKMMNDMELEMVAGGMITGGMIPMYNELAECGDGTNAASEEVGEAISTAFEVIKYVLFG